MRAVVLTVAFLVGWLLQPAVAADCEFLERVCAEPEATRVVNGVAVTRACWRFTSRYRCMGADTEEEPYCGELRALGCTQSASRCVDRLDDGRCVEHEQTYRCPSGAAVTSALETCGARVVCVGGDCFETDYPPNGDFALAASHLGAVASAVADFDAEAMHIFDGDARRCRKTALGFKNCCKASGWGVDLGLAQCSESEQVLGEQREAGQCHFVGSYREGSLFNRRSFHAFCCFRSKLGRIVQEQGRAQLDLDWGSARAPDCRGLTPEELTRIDFGALDLSEFYADAVEAAAGVGRPDADALAERLREQVLRLLPE
ncbi:MAG: conjugal transfer protein TraN [Chromatiales bacterium]|nr:conjugal transfer protein TraN [Chromatiales bacterium]